MVAGPVICKNSGIVTATRAEKFPTILVTCDGRFIGVIEDGAGILRLAVDIGSAVVNAQIENQKQGGDADLTLLLPLPIPGAFTVSSVISMVSPGPPVVNFKNVVITVFADQSFEVSLVESIAFGGSYFSTGIIGTGLANEMKEIQLPGHGRDFVAIRITNIGTAVMTVLSITHKTWEF